MIQKEVADRVCSKPNNKKFGRLSIISQLYFDAEKLFNVSADSFYPKPKVVSSVIHLRRKNLFKKVKSLSNFNKIVNASFSNKRKKLKNNIKDFFNSEQLVNIGINPELRAENLSILDYIKIANTL